MTEQMRDGLTASVALLLPPPPPPQAMCSQLSLWFLSSGVQDARKALWMTRLGVLVKEKARVTWTAQAVRCSDDCVKTSLGKSFMHSAR